MYVITVALDPVQFADCADHLQPAHRDWDQAGRPKRWGVYLAVQYCMTWYDSSECIKLIFHKRNKKLTLVQQNPTISYIMSSSSSSSWTKAGDWLTPTQHWILAVAGAVASTLSILGSTRILSMIFLKFRNDNTTQSTSRRREDNNLSYHRLVAGLSVADIIFSMSVLLAPFAMYPEGAASPTAVGTFNTCSVDGACLFIGSLAVALYNCSLSIMFVAMVVYSAKRPTITKFVEIPTHVITWLWSAILPIVALATQSFNPGPFSLVCGYNPFPLDCIDDELENEIQCQRGGEFYEILDVLHVLFLIVPSLTGIACTVWVYCSVRRTLQRNRRFGFNDSPQRLETQKQLSTQAILYTLSYLNTFLWPLFTLVASFAFAEESMATYVIQVFNRFFQLLLGFVNFLIYARPQYREWQRAYPQRWSGALIYWQVFRGVNLAHFLTRKERDTQPTSITDGGPGQQSEGADNTTGMEDETEKEPDVGERLHI